MLAYSLPCTLIILLLVQADAKICPAARLVVLFVRSKTYSIKPGKLPSKTIDQDYELEYGTDKIEVHVDAINKGDKVLIVDDLIATGGSAEAAVKLVKKMYGEIIECCFVIDLPDIGGRERLENMGQKVFTLCEFEGE